MRRTGSFVASVVLAVLACSIVTSNAPTTDVQTTSTKPNFVFILADDMRRDDLKYMPKTRSVLGQQGMSFANAYVSNAMCCPSRATILRGQYSHNTGVWNNANSLSGGWQGYKNHGNERDNAATRLDDAGYRTALIGKYLNHYRGTAVPQGWDYWFGTLESAYFDYRVNDNGTIRRFGTGEGSYATDVIQKEARRFVETSAAQGKPFFAYVAPDAPHGPFVPAPRDAHSFDGLKAPRPPSFDERNVSDKPSWIRTLPRLTDANKAAIDNRHESRAEMLRSLDDLVAGVVGQLRATGELKDTYVFFTSDNGFHHGEHRIPEGKSRPYEEDIRVPLLVRGPGVAAGSTTAKLALNTDFLPTLADLAGIRTPGYVDGRSLRSLLKDDTAAWRRTAILLEYRKANGGGQSYAGIRTSEGKKYIRYGSGFNELYDLRTDPFELSNTYDATSPPADMASRLQELKSCSGDSCRAAEDAP